MYRAPLTLFPLRSSSKSRPVLVTSCISQTMQRVAQLRWMLILAMPSAPALKSPPLMFLRSSSRTKLASLTRGEKTTRSTTGPIFLSLESCRRRWKTTWLSHTRSKASTTVGTHRSRHHQHDTNLEAAFNGYQRRNRYDTWQFERAQGNYTIDQPTFSLYPTKDPVADWAMVATALGSSTFLKNHYNAVSISQESVLSNQKLSKLIMHTDYWYCSLAT